MSSYVDKPLSLVERKKLQWAKEREELSNLCAPWGSTENVYDKPINRPRYARLSMQSNDFVRKDLAVPVRRPSLPPLVPPYKHQPNVLILNDKFERELGGETSGYGSDNPNHTPEHFQQPQWNQTLGGYESSSSYRDDRPKWGDRGVGVGKFWDPKDFNEYNKIMTADTPGWVKRGLQRNGELIVANSSPAESPEQTFQEPERPCTGSSGSQNRTYIRGQNVPLEPSELAERERRRQIALVHQEAIRQQLEEREQKRKEEKERRIREEREEELRIEREQEIERKRKEYEENLIKEKKERERKRKEALREAIELAEKEAKKMKQRMLKQNINENVKEKEDVEPKQLLSNAAVPELIEEIKQTNTEQCNNNNHVDIPQKEEHEVCHNINNNISIHNKDSLPNNIKEKVDNLNSINNNYNNNNITLPMVSPRNDNLALVLQTPIETLQGMQFAVLVPSIGGHISNNTLPIAVPVAVTPKERTENRILTPTQFRNRRFCDSSTQTDFVDNNRNEIEQKYLRDKLAQLEINYENRSRKERRRDERARESVEERPKWNANRPPTRYMKQSEKDPLYQRRKLRQKMRQIKTYDDKMNRIYSPHSSDNSQTASPRLYRKKGHGRALWRKNEQMFSRNVVYQTEIVPLESDKDQIYYKQKCGHRCCCYCQTEKYYAYPDQMRVVDIMKIEHNSPRDSINYKNENTQNDERLPECTRSSSIDDTNEVIQKLNTLHNGLIMKQEQWEKSPQTPTLCSRNKESPMAKLDDFLAKKKEVSPILDLSKCVPNSKEEFKKLLDKVPEFKIRPEKVRQEDVKIKDRKKYSFKTTKSDMKVLKEKFTFLDPLPQENLKIEELIAVSIDWKMLTTIRPKNKVEEDMFSRLVEIGKLEIKTRMNDKRGFTMDPQIRKIKNKAGVVEMRVVSCNECGEDFCNGKACSQFSYDSFARIPELPAKTEKKPQASDANKEKRKIKKKVKRRSRSKTKSKSRPKSRSKSKSKSPKKGTSKKRADASAKKSTK